MKDKDKKKNGNAVRISFTLTKVEADELCEARCELKPSTAAAQVVRAFLRGIKDYE